MTDARARCLPSPETLRELDHALQDLVDLGIVPVPPFPAVALRLQQEIRREDFGLAEAAELIGADAALAASVLRCANSAVHRRAVPVTSLIQAVTTLGTQQLVRLLMASGLAASSQAPGVLAPMRRVLWIEGLAGAATCEELARLRGLRIEEAFVLGLLHDFGKIVACSCLELLLQKHRIDHAWPLEAWSSIVERHHVYLGRMTAERWRLPRLVTDVLAAHHARDPYACEDAGLLEVVGVADEVVALVMSRPQVSQADLPAALSTAERAGLAHLLEGLPEFIAAFESPSSRSIAPSRLAHAERASASRRPAREPLQVRIQDRPGTWIASEIDESALVVDGPVPIAEGLVVSMELLVKHEELRLWAVAHALQKGDGIWRVELRPFCLSPQAREGWGRLLSGDGQGKQGPISRSES